MFEELSYPSFTNLIFPYNTLKTIPIQAVFIGYFWCKHLRQSTGNYHSMKSYFAPFVETEVHFLGKIAEKNSLLIRGCLDLFGIKIVQSSSGSVGQQREA